MIKDSIVARHYAKAIFDIAIEENKLAYWQYQLNFLVKLINNKYIKKVILTYYFYHDKLIKILIKICEEKTGILEKNLIKLMIKNNCLHIMKDVLEQFILLRREYFNTYIIVEVISVCRLKKDQINKITLAIKKNVHNKIKLVCKIDKSIIGGLILRIENITIDNSIRCRLNHLTNLLKI